MIRHCVLVKFNSGVPPAFRLAIYDDIAALRNKLVGMGPVAAGANVSPEGLGKGFADGFMIDFVDAAARDAYLVHPDHQAVATRLVAAVEGGVAGVLVFDLAVA